MKNSGYIQKVITGADYEQRSANTTTAPVPLEALLDAPVTTTNADTSTAAPHNDTAVSNSDTADGGDTK